jgi:UDP-2,3-diacylglucosamine pyrophosphatase LpxH
MRVLLLSDVHASGRSCPRQAALVALLRRERADVLVLAGDIFQRWADDGAAPHPELAPAVDAIARAAPRIVFTPGNHDWAAGPFLSRELGADVALEARLTLGGQRVHVSHGDEADSSAGYRALRACLRSAPVTALRRALGPALAWRLEGALGHAPRGRPDGSLVDAQRRRAHLLLARGDVDLVVNGHTHAAGIETLGNGLWVNPGDGLHSYAVIEDGAVRLCSVPDAQRGAVVPLPPEERPPASS